MRSRVRAAWSRGTRAARSSSPWRETSRFRELHQCKPDPVGQRCRAAVVLAAAIRPLAGAGRLPAIPPGDRLGEGTDDAGGAPVVPVPVWVIDSQRPTHAAADRRRLCGDLASLL